MAAVAVGAMAAVAALTAAAVTAVMAATAVGAASALVSAALVSVWVGGAAAVAAAAAPIRDTGAGGTAIESGAPTSTRGRSLRTDLAKAADNPALLASALFIVVTLPLWPHRDACAKRRTLAMASMPRDWHRTIAWSCKLVAYRAITLSSDEAWPKRKMEEIQNGDQAKLFR